MSEPKWSLPMNRAELIALIQRIEGLAAGNVTGCGTCTTIINEIRASESETKGNQE